MEHPHNGAQASSGNKDEILTKVGRNLLLFQQAERRLKWLAVRKRIAGVADEIEAAAFKLKEQVAGETLGMIMRRAIDSSGTSAREQERIEAAILEKGCVHLEIGFDFTGADGEPDVAWREGLEALVEDRNDLVHHFLGKFDLETSDGIQLAGHYLDQQFARHAPLVEDLRRRCEGIAASVNMLFTALNQEDIRAEFLLGHLRLILEEVLRRVAAEKARVDGWTYLSHAGKELAAEDPGLQKRLKEAFGHRGLKQAVAAMSGWELRDETTGGGGTRALYRSADSHPAIE
jgi:hypothetical protein